MKSNPAKPSSTSAPAPDASPSPSPSVAATSPPSNPPPQWPTPSRKKPTPTTSGTSPSSNQPGRTPTTDPADIVLCSHVIYTVRHIDKFIEKLTAHAAERVLVILHWDPPQHRAYRLWPDVHGEERIPLPAAPQLLDVLDEMHISYNVEDLPTPEFHGFQSPDEAWRQTRGMLFLTEGSEKDNLLRSAIPNHLEQRNGQLFLKHSKPMRPILITWPP